MISDDIEKKVDEFLSSRKNCNNLGEILELAQSNDKYEKPCIIGLERLFISLFQRNEFHIDNKLRLTNEREWEVETKYTEWLKETYEKTLVWFYKVLDSNKDNVETIALTALMKFLAAEAKCPLANIEEGKSSKSIFPEQRLEEIIKILVPTKCRKGKLITSYERYASYKDVYFYTWKILRKILPQFKESNDTFIFNVLDLMGCIPLPDSSSLKNDEDSETGGNKTLCELGDGNTFVISFNQVQKFVSKIWLDLINRNISLAGHRKLMITLLEKFLPHLLKPIYFTDFFISSSNLGGANALLALQGILVLIQKHNIEYPNIYGKLYAMFEPNILFSKYKCRLFYLADIFLSSTHLPENLVASFAKRVARLCLEASTSDIIIGIRFVENLLLRHPGLKRMIHYPGLDQAVAEDPFLANEPNPCMTKAIDSCLWEISLLKSHIQPSVSSIANFIDKNLPVMEIDLRESLDASNEQIFETESKKKLKPCLSISRPQKLAKLQDDRVYKMWNLTG